MKSLFRPSYGPWAWLFALVLLFAAGPAWAQKAKGAAPKPAPIKKDGGEREDPRSRMLQGGRRKHAVGSDACDG